MRHQYKKMDRTLCIGLLVMLAASAHAHSDEPTRWSRQISGYTSDISDWVPLTKPIERVPEQPIKRQAIAQPRILSEPFPGFSRPTGFSQDNFQQGSFYQNQNKPLYLQSVPSASQNYLSDQGFGQQSLRLALGSPQFPLSQGFVAPSYSFDSVNKPDINRFPQLQQSHLSSPVKFEPFQKKPPPQLSQLKPGFNTIPAPKRSETPKFMDGYRLENTTQDFSFKKRPQSLQKLKLEATPPALTQQFDNIQRNEKISEIFPTRQTRPTTNVEKEEVQLLYVPVESLNRGQLNYKNQNAQFINKDLYSSSAVQRPDSVNQFASKTPRQQPNFPQQSFPQHSFPQPTFPQPNFQQQGFQQQGFQQQGLQSNRQDYLNSLNSQKFNQNFNTRLTQYATSPAAPSVFPTSVTTPKPKKLKPHQPPLAVFMAQESNNQDSIKVADVLTTLKNAKNIAVLDSVSPSNSPKVFIGPSTLNPPENYVKFELPYLSNLENTDRKLRQLPFFVAPLSYNTPDGFAKIPFPSPHVGSVIVNSLLKDSNNPFATSTPFADIIPNSYTAGTPSFQGEKQTPFTNSITTNPTFSYFSTVPPKTLSTENQFQSNYFSFEPQGVTSIKPSREPDQSIVTAQPGSIPSYFTSNNFPSNLSPQHQRVKFLSQNKEQRPEPHQKATQSSSSSFNNKVRFNQSSQTTPQPPSTTRITSPKAPSTFPSHLLETHNPFSINQAFEFSSPFDYHNVYEENKNELNTPSTTAQTPTIPELVTEKETVVPSSPNYLQNYSPEIHYQSEVLSSRFPSFETNTYHSSTEASSENFSPSQPISSDFSSEKINEEITPASEPQSVQTTRSPYSYEEYTGDKLSGERQEIIRDNAAVSSTSTSTTTRRPLRSRGRPHSTTAKPDSSDATTRATVTRRPLRERKPLPSRNRIETVKSTTERPSRTQPGRTQSESSATEGSAYKSTMSRLRTRGRNHYKPTEHPDELYEATKRSKTKKEEDDIAYQRDVLHQNYPVTIMERMSTVDIEAITSPSPRISSTRFINREPATESYSEQESYVTEPPSKFSTFEKSPFKEVEPPTYTSRSSTVQTEATYVPRFSATVNEEPSYHSRSSTRQYEEQRFEPRPSSASYEQNNYSLRSSPSQIRSEIPEVSTEAIRSSSYSAEYESNSEDRQPTPNQSVEEVTTVASAYEISKQDSRVQLTENNNLNEESVDTDDNQVNTLPPVTVSQRQKHRMRPFPSRQSVSSTTDTTTIAAERITPRTEIKRRPVQPVTYRPAFDRRRTTMRIEEIEAGLKTKQVHVRPEEIPENRHPVYKPEPTTEPPLTTQSIKKITQYRRRRPVSTLTPSSTESSAASKKPANDNKVIRFRGRRPTTEKTTITRVENATSTTTRSLPYNRYNHRARVPERYNRKPATTESNEETEQDADYSIHRPKIVPYEEKIGIDGSWSPNLSTNSFTPYNPNDVQERTKSTEEFNVTNESNSEEPDIITVRNDYEDILLTVTPASNRLNKKLPEIPTTLEAFVEQTKSSTTGGDTISTIESVIEEMMKSLEEQDEDEYTRNVMKQESGEIGEIPPEKVISSAENTSEHNEQNQEKENTSDAPASSETSKSNQEIVKDRKGRRRGVWKKVRVRPVTTESFEVAESQFYTNTVNHLESDVKPTKTFVKKITQDTPSTNPAPPTENTEEPAPVPNIPETVEIKENPATEKLEETTMSSYETELNKEIFKFEKEQVNQEYKNEPTTVDPVNPGDMDLGTGSPDPTIVDRIYTQTTEATSGLGGLSILDSAKDINGVMDYLFGYTETDSEDSKYGTSTESITTTQSDRTNVTEKFEEISTEKSIATEVHKSKFTTESSYIPEEIAESNLDEDKEIEALVTGQFNEIKKLNVAKDNTIDIKEQAAVTEAENYKETVETSSVSSFMDPSMVISTSMSTEVSHETEICFRGKCIKTSLDLV